MERLRWVFELYDRLTAPATQMQSKLNQLNQALVESKSKTKSAWEEFGELGDKIAGLGTPLGGWVTVFKEVTGLVIGFVSAVAGAGTALGTWVAKTLAFKESTLTSFKMMEGTQEAAESMFNQAMDFARRTPFSSREVVDAFKSLRAAGFSREEVPYLFQGLGDVAAMSGGNAGFVIDSITRQMAQVKSVGKLQMVDLKVMATQMAGAGIGLQQVYAKIAKNMGIATSEVAQAMADSRVSADLGIFSIMEAIKERMGELGRGMSQQSTKLTGLFSTLQSAWEDLLLTSKTRMEDIPGVSLFKGTLGNLIKLFDTGNASGKRMQDTLLGMVNRLGKGLFSGLAGDDGLKRMEDIVVALTGGIDLAFNLVIGLGRGFTGMLKGMAPFMKGLFGPDSLDPMVPEMFGAAMERMGERIGQALGSTIALLEKLTSILPGPSTVAGAERVGASMTDGFLMGFAQNGLMGGIGGALGSALVEGFRGEKGIKAHSPSLKFLEAGEDSAAGYALGLDKGMGEVNGALVGMAQAPAAGPGRGRAGSGMTLHLELHIDNGGHQDGEQIARKLTDLLPGAIAGLLDKMAIETGEA